MVGRLMPRSPGSRVPSGLRHPANWRWLETRLSPKPTPQGLTVATTVGTTRFCRTRGSLAPQRPTALCTLPSAYWHDEPDSAAHLARRLGLTESNPPCPLTSRTTLPRPPQARLANMTTTRSPLKDEPGCATHTPFPNFGKVECFCRRGLTHGMGVLPDGQRKGLCCNS